MVISAEKPGGLQERLGAKLFELLRIIRVYTKQPGKPAAVLPIVGKRGMNVGDLAKAIHSDFYDRFKYARIRGPSAKFESGRVGIDHVLHDGDIVQFHT